jgi:hypothetical protein
MQAPDADADLLSETSEGIFVYEGDVASVALGDSVVVTATVSEYYPGGYASNNLSITELTGPEIEVVSPGNPLPSPVLIGSGLIPPNQIIENDATGDVETPPAVFDIGEDGIDLWESMEGMRLTVTEPLVVGPTNAYGEIPVVADLGAYAGAFTANGGLLLTGTDGNPERIILDDLLMPLPDLKVGDIITPTVTGVLDYNFGNFKLLVAELGDVVPGDLEPEAAGRAWQGDLTVATFNVLNLWNNDPRVDGIAGQIVNNLRSPDILGLQEIEDNSGPTDNGVVDANASWSALINAITAAGGPTYEFRDINPVDNQDGGVPGGNIRCGFLFNPLRVDFVDIGEPNSTTAVTVTATITGPVLSLNPGRIDPLNPAFVDSRKPLIGQFEAQGERLFLIVNHFNSKGGDTPLFGRVQPPVLNSETQRVAQATVVNDFVKDILNIDDKAKIIVLGDLNDFPWSAPMMALEGTQLKDVYDDLPPAERYSYIYDGNSQALDYILASSAIVDLERDLDVVHINAEWPASLRPADHDPLWMRVRLRHVYMLPLAAKEAQLP